MIIWPEKIVFRSLCLQRLRNTIFSIMRRYSLFSQKINIYDMFLLEMRILPIGYHISYDLLSPCNQSPAYIFPTLFVLISTWQVDIRHLPLAVSLLLSVPTLCKIAHILRLSTDFILFGTMEHDSVEPLELLLKSCSTTERSYAEQLLKTFLLAMNSKKDSSK